MAAQVEADDSQPGAELVDQRAALEQQVVVVLAEPVQSTTVSARVQRTVLLVVQAARRRSVRTKPARSGSGGRKSSTGPPARRVVRTRLVDDERGAGGCHAGRTALPRATAPPRFMRRAASVGAGHARADAGDDLVVDRADRLCPVDRARPVRACAEQDRLVLSLTSRSPTSTTNWSMHTRPLIVNRVAVDRHRADVRRVPRDAVGVAERHERERGVAFGRVRRGRTRRPRRRGRASRRPARHRSVIAGVSPNSPVCGTGVSP